MEHLDQGEESAPSIRASMPSGRRLGWELFASLLIAGLAIGGAAVSEGLLEGRSRLALLILGTVSALMSAALWLTRRLLRQLP